MLFSAFRKEPDAARASAFSGTPVTALVELYTSEGCSSCPAAEELLPHLRQQNVFVLEFHVDYWDRLGWKDPFSDPAFSARQRAYAQRFRLSSLYTPEAVINGAAEQVGSDQEAISGAIDRALAANGKREEVGLRLTAQEDQGRVTISYIATGETITNKKEPPVICLALVQLTAVSKIGAGENRGRTLRHVNLVRSLKTETATSGSVGFTFPDGLKAADLGVTAWVQEAGNAEVKSVSAISLKP